MNNQFRPAQTIRLSGLCLLALFALTACDNDSRQHPVDDHGHHGGSSEGMETSVPERGPNNGRLLVDGDFMVELAIFEDGVPPEYHAWVTQGGTAIPPDAVNLVVELKRLDGEINRFEFAPEEDFLRGNGVVTEPHSFDVTVTAEHAGKTHQFAYPSYEGRVTIAAESANVAGIVTASAGPRLIYDVLPLYGRITIHPDAVRDIRARYPGTIRSVARSVGDPVRAGDVLARVESDDSLQIYDVLSPLTGTVTARQANPGEQAGFASLFTISDLGRSWAELSVFPGDLSHISIGQNVRLTSVEGERRANGTIVRIAPAGSDDTGTIKVWASIGAESGVWTPGLFVKAEVLTGGAEVPIAVSTTGLQTFRDFTVVFAKVGDTYEVRMLELGRTDGEFVEVLAGLKPDAEYVRDNSYLIKADIEKSGASHDH